MYWGETHLHTGLSLDAGLFGNILGHEDGYRFARGEKVISNSGQPAQLTANLGFSGRGTSDPLTISDM